MGNPFVVVLTSKNSGVKSEKLAYANYPQEALEILEKQGFEKALVAGGGKTNRSFLKENLIDEIYLDVEPMIYGEGISLFNSTNSKLDLELIGQKMLNKNTIQLHYKVIK
jgi:dihydrofolate reductase